MRLPGLRCLSFYVVLGFALPGWGCDEVGGVLDNTNPLAGQDFSLRRRSTLDLWRDRERYRNTVLAAVRSGDPETAERAQWVLGRWQRGILADTPPEIIGQLEILPPVQAIEMLLETQRFAAATVAMQEAAATLDHDSIVLRIASTLGRRFPVYARAAVLTSQTAEFLAFLDIACSTKELAVCRHDWALLFPPPSSFPPTGAANAHDANAHDPDAGGADGPPPRPLLGLGFQASQSDGEPGSEARAECLLQLIEGNVERALEAAARGDREIQNLETQTRGHAAQIPKNDADPPAALVFRSDQSLLRIVQMICGKWREMAESSNSAAQQLEQAAQKLQQPNSAEEQQARPAVALQILQYQEEAVRHWSDALIAADRCGDAELRQAAVAGVLRHHQNPSLGTELRSLIWRTLLIHGEVTAALDVAGQADPEAAAFIALDASRGAEALEQFGFPAEQVDTQLETWIDTAIAAQQTLYQQSSSIDPQEVAEAARQSETGVASEVTKLLTLIRLLDALALDEAAWRIADRLSAADIKVRRVGSSQEFLVRDYVLSSLLWTRHSDWMIRLGMRSWETEPSPVSFSLLTQMTITEERMMLPLLMRYLKQSDGTLSEREAFRIACEIARANEQDRRKHADLMPELAASVRESSVHRKSATEVALEASSLSEFSEWSELFLAHGRADLAEPFLEDRAASGDLQARFKLIDEYRFTRPMTHGADAYREIWDAVASPEGDSHSPPHDDVMIGVKAIAKEFHLARDSRDLQTADRILDQLRAMACTPSAEMRGQIAELLGECGQWEAADTVYQSALKMTALSAQENMTFLDIARKYRAFTQKATTSAVQSTRSAVDNQVIERLNASEIELRRRAIQWFDIALVSALPEIDFRPQVYLRYPRQTARDELNVTIIELQNRPQPETRQHAVTLLHRLGQLDRLDITSAESLFPKLKKLGLGQTVDEAVVEMLRTAEEHLKVFPGDAVIANNVAWGAAMNAVELPTALELSRQAVRWEPDSAIYRDTLAEILARSGNPAEAVLIEQGCLLDDPGQWHLREQIEKYKKILSNSR